jgi:ornithine cyclodeaminase/alanine dehydrogenase-like protein (mu-crystallin family)
MSTLILTTSDLKQIDLSMREAITACDQAFKAYGEGKVSFPGRWGLHYKEGRVLDGMPGYLEPINVGGIKWIYVWKDNPIRFKLDWVQGVLILNDGDTGKIISIMRERFITNVRTGAVAAVGAKYLARRESKVVAIIGAGAVARTSLAAFHEVLPDIKEVRVADIVEEARDGFVREMKETLEPVYDIVALDSNEEATMGADVIACQTKSSESWLEDDMVKAGCLVIDTGGSNVDVRLARAVDRFVVDHFGTVSTRGDFAQLFQKGELTRRDVYAEFGEIVAGKKLGRASDGERILYKHSGMGIMDIAVGYRLYSSALEKRIGQYVSL